MFLRPVKRWLWGFFLAIAFQCARIGFTIAGKRIRGALVFIWHRGRIMLIKKTYRKAWSIPGGLAKKGETRRQTAVREVFEEVGIRLNEEDLVFIEEIEGDLGPRDKAHLFEVELCRPFDVKIDEREILQAEFVLPEIALKRNLYEPVEAYLKAT